MADGLQGLLNPTSIAIIGATDTPGKPGRRVMENLLTTGCRLYPVHPTRAEVFGRRAYHRVEDLPETVDLAVIAVGAEAAVGAAENCGARGIPFVVVLAGGFGETGPEGRSREARLSVIHETFGTRILGPNTLGLQIPGGLDTVFVDHATAELDPNGVAVISQSGSVGIEMLRRVAETGFALRVFIGLGNAVDLGATEFVRHFGADEKAKCIAVYAEHLDGGRALLEACAVASASKPVLFLKAGQTESGAAAVESHTGRLAGSDRVTDSAFRQYRVQRVSDDEELTDAVLALTLATVPLGNRVAVVTAAGGFGVMCVDMIEAEDSPTRLRLATLSEETVAAITEIALPFASCRNPVDLTAGVDDGVYGTALRQVLEDDDVDIVIPIALFAPEGISESLISEMVTAIRETHKTAIVLCQAGVDTARYIRRFYEQRIAAFPSIARTVRAARILVQRRQVEEALA